jgi:hypothetical protein
MLAATVSPGLERIFGSIIVYKKMPTATLLAPKAIAFAGHEIGVEQHGKDAVIIRPSLASNQ